jgi:hypothetical protein
VPFSGEKPESFWLYLKKAAKFAVNWLLPDMPIATWF